MKANEISNMLWQEIIQLKLSLEYNDKLEKSGVYFVFFSLLFTISAVFHEHNFSFNYIKEVP